MKSSELLAIASGLLKPGDYHFVVNSTNDNNELQPCPGKLYNHTGTLVRKWEVLTQGVAGPGYKLPNGDTVEGVFVITSAIPTQPWESAAIKRSYGRWFFGLGAGYGLQDYQALWNRAGIGIHGQYFEDRRQSKLSFTHGCMRMFNDNLDDAASLWVPTIQKGNKVVVTVDQED